MALQHLDDVGSATTKQLAAALNAEPSNVTGIIDRLEQAGLIERSVPRHDRRVKLLSLTPDGKDVRKRVDTAFNDTDDFFDGLSPTERQQPGRLLRRLTTSAE